MYTIKCSECGEDVTADNYCQYCDVPPDDYIKPGTDALMYVNTYEVTRHYGGPEEGGWWYNHDEPIASIPVQAVSVEGHNDSCWNCSRARSGEESYNFCKWSFHLVPKSGDDVDYMTSYSRSLFENRISGDIYSANGGVAVKVVLEDHVGERTPKPHYE